MTATMALLALMMATGCRAQDRTASETVPPAEATVEPTGSGFSEAELDRFESGLDEIDDLIADVERSLDEPVPGGD